MRTKKVKPPPKEFEYVLSISKQYDDIKKKDYISFNFKTTKEFLTFKYILKIEIRFKIKELDFNILGFSAPLGELSNYGHAGYEYRMYDYKFGEYHVIVDKRDSDSTKFKLILQKSKSEPIKVSHVPRKTFIPI